MKRIFLFGALLICGMLRSQINVHECNPENSTITQQELVGNQAEISKPCVIFDSPQNYNYVGNQQKTISAYDEIHIKSDFHTKPTGNGELHLKSGNKADFEVVCMNYPDLLHVLKYKKFELGITLPEGVKQKVENFVNKVPNSEQINPYLAFNIRIECEFKHPDRPYPLTVDAFYNKEFESWMGEIPEYDSPKPWNELENFSQNNYNGIYNQLGGYNEIPSEYPFLARFAPPFLGKWECVVHIYVDNNNIIYNSEPFYFEVIESGSPGLVKISDDQRSFELGGEPFYPLGANILWPQTVETKNNPGIADEKLVNLLKTVPTNEPGVYTFLSEDYRSVRPLPILYDNWRNHVRNIADNGGNFVRIIMHPFSSDIEFEDRGDYTDRLYIAQELDEFLEYCESRNVYIDWNMMNHFVLQSGVFYSTAWDSHYQGEINDYRNITGMDNNPDKFFTLAEAKYYFTQKLRYVLSRWGYSTNIAMFELCSEINNHGNTIQEANDHEAWNNEMARYLKERYNGVIHIIQPGYTGFINLHDRTYASPDIDVMTTNFYVGSKTFARNWILHINKVMLNQKTEENTTHPMNLCSNVFYNGSFHLECSGFTKPFFMPEFDPGGDVKNAGVTNPETCDALMLDVRRAMWQVPFTGVAGGLSWNSYKNGIVYSEFSKIKTFMENMSGKGGWHPGAMELKNDGRWEYKDNWADDMDGYNKRADLSYMRSNDKNYAIGVITNKTVNVYSLGASCNNALTKHFFDSIADIPKLDLFNIDVLGANGTIHTEDQGLYLNGLKNGRYYINYFYPDNQSTPFDSDDNFGPRIKLETTIPGFENTYIVLFMARRSGSDWLPEMEDSIRELAESHHFVSKTVEIEIHDQTENQSSDLDLSVYPIPALEKIVIEASQLISNIEIKIVYSEGKVLDQLNMVQTRSEVDISSYSKGVYIVKFYLNGDEIEQKKIVKL